MVLEPYYWETSVRESYYFNSALERSQAPNGQNIEVPTSLPSRRAGRRTAARVGHLGCRGRT